MTEIPGRNPFLPPPVEEQPEEILEGDSVVGDVVAVEGPTSPIHAPREANPRLDILTEEAPTVASAFGTATLVGLHGGAGVSTMAHLLGERGQDGGTRLPVANPYVPAPRVVLVARTHLRGLEKAEQVATAWSHHELDEIDLLGLVLVDDGPKLGTAARAQAARLLRMTPHGWHVPWVEAWRTSVTPSVTGIRLPRVVKSIRRVIETAESKKGTTS